jgi:23S rRNA (cytosine1962-C5)-methyltransferase
MKKSVILKKDKEKVLHHKHHWVFSGAIQSLPKEFEEGEILPVFSFANELLGHGYFNRKSSLSGRMISFGDKDPMATLLENIKNAMTLRTRLFSESETAYRLINGEGDLIPGLIVDRYGDYLVIQISTLGMERLKKTIVEHLSSLIPVKGIYEKSLLPTRKEEGLEPFEGNLFGDVTEYIEISENGSKFLVSYLTGQKTGFFLDQREMRLLIGNLSKGKRVLNCFCYTGGFTISALTHGAKSVDSIDISKEAMKMCEENLKLNGFSTETNKLFTQDVTKFLRNTTELPYDIVILDPPAFAKKKQDVIPACKGYKEINRQAIQKMPKGSILLTCSCSYHVDEELFQKVVFGAANDANRSVKIISKHRLSPDHPINLYHKEGNYLKSLVLYID